MSSKSNPFTLHYRHADCLELSGGYSATTLDLLDDRDDLCEERM
jgi:hypothetical protein